MESVVECVDVASAEAASVSDAVSKLEGHLVHEAERAAARGFRETNGVGVKLGKRVGRKALRAKLGFDGRDEVVADRAEVRAPNAYPEDGEQRAGMREQETLLPIDPEQVQYQSSSVGGSSLSVTERLPSRSSIRFVQRTTIRRTYQPALASFTLRLRTRGPAHRGDHGGARSAVASAAESGPSGRAGRVRGRGGAGETVFFDSDWLCRKIENIDVSLPTWERSELLQTTAERASGPVH
jgi:hypothetical protein